MPWPRSAEFARASPRTAGQLAPACGRCSCRGQSACARCAPRVALVTPVRASWSRAGLTGSRRRSAGSRFCPRLGRRGWSHPHRRSVFRARAAPWQSSKSCLAFRAACRAFPLIPPASARGQSRRTSGASFARSYQACLPCARGGGWYATDRRASA